MDIKKKPHSERKVMSPAPLPPKLIYNEKSHQNQNLKLLGGFFFSGEETHTIIISGSSYN